WARSDDFRRPLARRLQDLGLGRGGGGQIERAVAAPGWRPLAALDASTRFAAGLVRAGALRRGREVRRMLPALLERTWSESPGQSECIPEAYWSVRPVPAGPGGEEQVVVRGAVLLRARGPRPSEVDAANAAGGAGSPPLSPELAAARAEPDARPWHALRRVLAPPGPPAPPPVLAPPP